MATVTAQLASAANYVLLAAAGITNSGSSIISGGNIGSYPTTSITPGAWILIPPSVIDNADAQQANLDGLAAYNYFAALPFTSLSASSVNLSVSGNGATPFTYTPGNYSAGTSMDIPTSITLDAQGNPQAVFIFKAGSTVTLESGASIILANGANAANVVWLVGSSLTTVFAGVSVFNGQVLAATSITLGGGNFNGRALAGLVNSSGAITIATALTMTGSSVAAQPTTAGGQAQALIASQPGQTFLQAYPQVTPNGIGPQNLDLMHIKDEGGFDLVTVDYTGAVHGGAGSYATSFASASVAVSTFAVTNVVASTGVYTGTFTGGAANAFAGQNAVILGFTNGGNNGTKLITASSATTITVSTAGLVNETASATASVSNFSLATYTGTITGGANNAYAGRTVTFTGFLAGTGANNVTALVISSTATTLVVAYSDQVTETQTGLATLPSAFAAVPGGTRLGTYYTRLGQSATIAQIFADAFTNPSLLDIVHIVNLGGNISYVLNYQGVASGS
jgi:hypothetical protein